MPLTSAQVADLLPRPFEVVAAEHGTRAFGVPYVALDLPDGDQLFLTRYGWNVALALLPQQWHHGDRYARDGQKLAGTSTVYRLASPGARGRDVDLVVKFSRMAQEVPLHVAENYPGHIPQNLIDQARFNSPFEEFGLLMELRAGWFGPSRLRIRTKRPLAIYSPPGQFPLWQLGRSPGRFANLERHLSLDQDLAHVDPPLHLDIQRDYVVIFAWIEGDNAEVLATRGVISDRQMTSLARRAELDLRSKGFRVLDHKPRHIILRQRGGDGPPLTRQGEIVYALIDFELLQRTEAYGEYLSRLQADPVI